MTWGWVSTVSHHRWMSAIALKAPMYVQTMGLAIVCFQIIIESPVVGGYKKVHVNWRLCIKTKDRYLNV